MSIVSSREQLKDYCLRRLGYPVIEINVSDEQIEDRISDAFQFYTDYHYDAVSKYYLKHTVTAEDIENRSVTVDDSIVGVVRILPLNNLLSKSYMWDIRYQLILNNLWDLSSTSMMSYTISMQHIRALEQLFVGEMPMRFERHQNKIFADIGWGTNECPEGTVMVFECYKIIDPEVYTDVFNDRWIKEYSTALIKRQWAENIRKYQGITLPGGINLNGDNIYQDALQQIKQLEAEMQDRYELPVEFMIG